MIRYYKISDLSVHGFKYLYIQGGNLGSFFSGGLAPLTPSYIRNSKLSYTSNPGEKIIYHLILKNQWSIK